MISTLRSIDCLLNKFDELSKCHTKFLLHFDTYFPDIKNPLRNVARTEGEQQKSVEKILLGVNENDEQFESLGSLGNFHRRTTKSQYLHRPPCYSSNDTSLNQRVPPRSSSIISLPKISLITFKEKNSQPIVPISNKKIIKPKVNLTTKNKPKIVSKNSHSPQQHVHGIISAFTMEMINRLSKPKRYNRFPNQNPSIKHMKQQLKSYENMKKEASKCTTLPPIKQTKTSNIKPSSKEVKLKNKILVRRSKRNPVNNFSHPLVFITPIPTE